jgi:TM2 domain-containing membrane protein YozV
MTIQTKALDEKFCSECGAAIKARAEICPKCGVRQSGGQQLSLDATTPSGKNKTIAGVLALILGGLGIHKFYLGKTGLGIVYLLFCWTFIPALIGFIEGVLLLVMSNDNFEKKFG